VRYRDQMRGDLSIAGLGRGDSFPVLALSR